MTPPLHGLKILDFTRLLPGPFGTMMLADLGAEVLRVEPPNFPDIIRMRPPFDGSLSGAHCVLNRGKGSILLDLKKPEGVEVVKRLVKEYDIVVEQFRPGVMKRLGVGYEELRAENERLIYCSITGYGQDGPYVNRAGHDINYLSLAGIMSYTGRRNGGPLPLGVQIADLGCGGYNAVVSILAAAIHRERTGEGQCIDISMTDGAILWGFMGAMNYLVGNELMGREDDVLNGGIYYDCYETKDGQYMSVGSLEPQFYEALCRALGREDLIPKHMARDEEAQALKAEFVAEFKKKTRDEWTKVFEKVDACVEPVLSTKEMTEHPNTRARNMVVEVPKPDGPAQKQVGSPFKFSRTPPEIRHIGVELGVNTEEILKKTGYSEEDIERMRKAKVFG
ncbi:MAG: CoA transferase [Deltaproteobacteria bacterium]|nr:MAG: CoA transferase [Deltaproteobacteria bacterium]